MPSGNAGVPCNIWISGIQLPQGHNASHFSHFKINTECQVNAESTPVSIRNLAHLTGCKNITICKSSPIKLQDIDSISELKNLRELNLVNIESLMEISWIQSCQQLTHLVLFGCSNLHDITPLRELKNLTVLDIRGTNVKNSAFLTNSRLTITK
jgi:Leucine-rich repeat (LRR) protein